MIGKFLESSAETDNKNVNVFEDSFVSSSTTHKEYVHLSSFHILVYYQNGKETVRRKSKLLASLFTEKISCQQVNMILLKAAQNCTQANKKWAAAFLWTTDAIQHECTRALKRH